MLIALTWLEVRLAPVNYQSGLVLVWRAALGRTSPVLSDFTISAVALKARELDAVAEAVLDHRFVQILAAVVDVQCSQRETAGQLSSFLS